MSIENMLKKILPVLIITLIFTVISCDTNQKIEIKPVEVDNSDLIKNLSEAIKKSPENPNFYFQRGELFLESNQLKNAKNDFDKTINLMPEATLAYIYRAKVFFELKNTEKATLDYSKAIELTKELTKDNWELFKFRGITYMHSQNFNNAAKDFSKALEIKLEEFQNIENEKIQISDLYYLRGDAFASLKNYDQALSDFQKALEFNSKNIDAKNSIKKISKIQ